MKILLTAFRGTSSDRLSRDIADYQTLILPNDKTWDSKMLIETIRGNDFDYVISLGQRPNIKNKVHIETVAKEGELQKSTIFDCEGMKMLFEENGIDAKLSHNAGTSFCNKLYFESLKFISENKTKTKMVFVHIPFEKNINDWEGFVQRFMQVLNCLKEGA